MSTAPVATARVRCKFPRCGRPAVGVCTLCSDAVCGTHAARDFHFNVRRFAA